MDFSDDGKIQPAICDFGLARQLGTPLLHYTSKTHLTGFSVRYTAPELFGALRLSSLTTNNIQSSSSHEMKSSFNNPSNIQLSSSQLQSSIDDDDDVQFNSSSVNVNVESSSLSLPASIQNPSSSSPFLQPSRSPSPQPSPSQSPLLSPSPLPPSSPSLLSPPSIRSSDTSASDSNSLFKKYDIYAFSIIIFEILNQSIAWNGLNASEIEVKVMNGYRPESILTLSTSINMYTGGNNIGGSSNRKMECVYELMKEMWSALPKSRPR